MEQLSQATIDTEPGPIPTRDVSYFLYLFRAVYVAALESGYEQIPDEKVTETIVTAASAQVAVQIKNLPQEELSRLALPPFLLNWNSESMK